MTALRIEPGRVFDLGPFVPRLVVDWQRRDPGGRHRTVEGTMLSADISGFTRLSEKLAGLGKQGAEELTAVINTCFDGMIDVAASAGGDVLKFGGDALLILFTGHDHAARAAQAAVGMRATIDRPVAAATGRVQLRMSQGMHSGAFTFFLVDAGHRELIVTGPGPTATVRCEAAAEAGQVLLSPAAARGVPPDWLADPTPQGRLLRRRVPDLARYVDVVGDAPPVDLTAFVPSSQIERADVDGEHRPATIAFVEFAHTDGFLERGEPDTLADRLDELATAVRTAVNRYGVHWLASDVYADGGKVILSAGAPTTAGDDEERMVRAVRAVLDDVEGLPLRAGVNGGRVFAGHVGGGRRRTYTTMGDAVNLAARLMQKASGGQMVVSTRTLDAAGVRARTTPLEPFLVKGKLEPIHAALVETVEQAAADDRDDTGLPLVGRDTQLAALEGVLAAATAHRADAVVDVVGEHGVGKSRLVAELAGRHPELPVLTATCGRYARETPYFAARSLLRVVAGIDPDLAAPDAGELLAAIVGEHLPDAAPLLPLLAVPFDAAVAPTPEAEAVAPAFRRARSHDLVLQLLDRLLPRHGVLVVDEAQWLDDASRSLLGALAERAGGRGWLVCVLRTPGPSPFAPVVPSLLALGRLDAAAATALASAAAEPHVWMGRREIDALAARGAGHPLYTLQLVAAAAASGSVDALPASVETAVTARMDLLPARERTRLREAAVLGARVDVGVLAAVAGDGTLREQPAWLPLEDFVSWHGDHVRFRHALFQQVAYEGLPFRRRKVVHGLVGDALERSTSFRADAESELLSLHFHHADDHGRAWRYSLAAARDAVAKYANAEAREFYERALRHAGPASPPPDELASVHEALGDVCEVDGAFGRARVAYRAATRLRDGDVDRAHLLRKQGLLCEREGRYSDALRWYGRALRIVGGGDEHRVLARAELAIAYAGVRYRQGRPRDCVRLAEQAWDDASPRGARGAQAHAAYLLGLAHGVLRDGEAARWLATAEAIYERTGDLVGLGNTLNNLGMDAYFSGRWADALEWYRRSRDARERAGDAVGSAMSACNIGEILSDQGHHDEAEALFRDALRAWQRAGYPAGIAFAKANLGRLAARRGSVAEALDLLGEALAGFAALDAAGFVTEVRARRAEVLLLAARHAEAERELDDLAADLTRLEPAVASAALRSRALVAAGRGDGERAARDLASSRQVAAGAGLAHELALTLAATAEILGDAEAGTRAGELLAQLGVATPAPAR